MTSSFNGATAFRRWKRLQIERAEIQNKLLQWGHRLSAMETAISPLVMPCSSHLQWGHRLSAMETYQFAGFFSVHIYPSMGPPPFGDGNVGFSLWPVLNGASLQWGHRLSAMETSGSRCGPFVNGGPFNGATAFRRWKPLFVARLRHGFIQKRVFPQEPVTG